MMLAHRHAERPGHVPCVPGDGRPAQGVMRPHSPQAVVRPNQALRRLPRQGIRMKLSINSRRKFNGFMLLAQALTQ